jgi:hypothetical protein
VSITDRPVKTPSSSFSSYKTEKNTRASFNLFDSDEGGQRIGLTTNSGTSSPVLSDKQQQQLNPDAETPAAGSTAQQQQQQSEDVVVDDKDAQDVLDEAAAAEALVDAAVEEAAAMTKSANSAADGSAGVEDTPQVCALAVL